jgi:hypothetical protein
MCERITKLAKQNQFQWIGICPHGSAHLYWRKALVSFKFEALDKLMNLALKGMLPVESYGDGYLIWLDQVAIKLTEKDYIEILELFVCAAETPMRSMSQIDHSPQVNKHERMEKIVLH